MVKQSGFTLIEIVVSVAIVGILAALAIPSYSQYVEKSRRVEAQSVLLEMAGRQVRYHSENNTYADAVGVLGYGSATATTYESESGTYDIEVSASSVNSFTLTATPKNGQAADDCGSLSYNSAGQKTIGGSTVTVQECW